MDAVEDGNCAMAVYGKSPVDSWYAGNRLSTL